MKTHIEKLMEPDVPEDMNIVNAFGALKDTGAGMIKLVIKHPGVPGECVAVFAMGKAGRRLKAAAELIEADAAHQIVHEGTLPDSKAGGDGGADDNDVPPPRFDLN